MNGALFLVMFGACSLITGLVTEAEKKLVKDFSTNLLALITGAIVALAVTVATFIFRDIPYNTINVTYVVILIFASGLGAMLGYDKVMQTIKQILGSDNNGNKD